MMIKSIHRLFVSIFLLLLIGFHLENYETNAEKLPIYGWERINHTILPPTDPTPGSQQEFLYARNCEGKVDPRCIYKMEIPKIDFQNFTGLQYFTLSFKYWTKFRNDQAIRDQTSLKVHFDNNPDNLNLYPDGNNWVHKHYNRIQFKPDIGLSIEIKIPKNANDTIIAIKDIEIIHEPERDAKNLLPNITCTRNNCTHWKFTAVYETLLWSNVALPSSNQVSTEFFYPTLKNSSIYIPVTKFNPSVDDLCIDIKYWISSQSLLHVNYIPSTSMKSQLFTLTPTIKQLNPTNITLKWENAVFCIKDLIIPTSTNFSISFDATMNRYETGEDVVAISINEIQHLNETNANPLPFLHLWNKEFHEIDEEWVLSLPYDGPFNITKKIFLEDKNLFSIKFKAIAYKNIFSSAQLISQWIKINPNLVLNYSISLNESNTDFFVVPKVCNEIIQCMEGPHFIPGRNPMVNFFSIPFLNGNYLKIIFNVTYFSKTSQETLNETDIEFNLGPVMMGDPCSLHSKCGNHGKCIPQSPNSFTCNCSVGYEGDYCNIINYCNLNHSVEGWNGIKTMTGNQYCISINSTCKSNVVTRSALNVAQQQNIKLLNFECICPNQRYWNAFNKTCIQLKPCDQIICDSSQGQECDDLLDAQNINNKPCRCKVGWKEVSKEPLVCEWIDVCKSGACGTAHYCVGFDRNQKPTCGCEPGFLLTRLIPNDENSSYCQPILCNSPALNSCQHICTNPNARNPNDATIQSNKLVHFKVNYTCSCYQGYQYNELTNMCQWIDSNNACTIKCPSGICTLTECKCRKGYEWKGNACQATHNSDMNQICPINYIDMQTNSHYCNCTADSQLDTTTGLCKRKLICANGSNGQKTCSRKAALCIERDLYAIVSPTDDLFECRCPKGTVEWNDTTIGDTKCVDPCSIPENQYTCEMNNAKCANKFVDPYKNENKNEKPFDCICKPGFIHNEDPHNTDLCVMAPYSIQAEIMIRNKYYSGSYGQTYSDARISSYANTAPTNGIIPGNIKEMLESQNYNQLIVDRQLVKEAQEIQLLQNVRDSVKMAFSSASAPFIDATLINCTEQQQAQILKCNFILQFSSSPSSEPKSILKDHCKNSITNLMRGSCFLPPSLILDSNTFSSQSNFNVTQPCSLCPINTQCIRDSDRSQLYSCQCDQRYSNVLHNQLIGSEIKPDGTTKKYSIQYCQDIDECSVGKHTCGENQECIKTFGKPGYFCRCKDKFVNDKNNGTKCLDVCHLNICNGNGKCVAKGNNDFACECYSSYYGDSCQHDVSIIGWIICVTLLSILLLIAIGIGIIYFNKSRSKSSLVLQPRVSYDFNPPARNNPAYVNNIR